MEDIDDQTTSSSINSKSMVPVVPVSGSPWIMYRSKSHGDRIYYFNTETGIAVWNLGAAEIEKAKKQNINNSNMPVEGYPEPKQPPKETSDYDQVQNLEQNPTTSKTYNNQIISNSFIRQPNPITAFVAPNCSRDTPPSDSAKTGSSKSLSMPDSACNYNMSTVPHDGVPTIIAPMSMNVKQVKTNVNAPSASTQTFESLTNSDVGYDDNVMLQNRYFQIFTEKECQTSPRHFENDEYIPRASKTLFGQRALIETEIRNRKREFDLRQVLSSRRKTLNSDVDELEERSEVLSVIGYEELHCDSISNNGTSVACDTGEESFHSDADSDWLEDNVNVQGKMLRLNVTSLKKLASMNADPDHWYIAIDKMILLRHLNFLNTLYNSDDQCHLMVPRAILTDLREEAQCASVRRRSRRARRAVSFITQQLDAGTAVIGADSYESRYIEIPYILNCCLSLVEQFYHVVLISNSCDLQRYKNTTSIPIFSIKELKEYLSKNNRDEEQDELETEQPILPSTHVKIVIPNNLLNNPYKTAPENVKGNMASDLIPPDNRQQKPQENYTNKSDGHICPSLKVFMADAGVQTVKATDTLVEPREHNATPNAQNLKDMNSAKAGHSSQSMKVSKIRLKRLMSNPPAGCVATSVEKKQFKWRRSRANHTNISNLNHNPNRTEKTAVAVSACTQAIDMTTESFKGGECSKINENLTLNRCASQQSNVSCDVNLENSETCSEALIQKSLSEKLVIEDSTSGVISNTTGNVDSNRSSVDKETVNKNVMFEVTDHSMEDYLTIRCDEWVSRYVQIMEEVLSQVLQQYPQFLPSLTPPPWTLHEAIECIGSIFHDKNNITIAVKKLLKVLENVCEDKKSRICMDIKPSDYMQLYSYGVYLVETLQLAVKNCEDLQTAVDSLTKLLYDIKNPHLNSTHKDGLHPTPAVSSTRKKVPNERLKYTDVNKKHQHKTDTIEIKEILQDSNIKESYNLRSRKRRFEYEQMDEEPDKPNTTFVNNCDVEFFTSLDLQKKVFHESLNTHRNMSSNDEQLKPNSQSSSMNLHCNGDIEARDTVHCTSKSENNKAFVEPKFIRKYIICPELEEKLSKSPRRSSLDIDALNCSQYEYDHTEEDEYYRYETNSLEAYEAQDENSFENKSNENANPNVDINSNSNFKWLFRQITNETKEAIKQVTCFCKNTSLELSNDLSKTKKVSILKKAENAYQRMDNLHTFLSSIYDQEKFEHGNDIPSRLRKAGIEHIDFGDELFLQYTYIIEKFMNEAKNLLAVVNVIIDSVKRTSMAGYFEEMGWTELQDGEQPNHLLHMARFLIDFGLYDDHFSGEWPRLPPPAAKEAVNSLPEITMDVNTKNCPICLKNFNVGEKAKEMPCHHVFHATCILTWLERTNSCPFCRHELPTDDEAYEAFKQEKKRAEQRKEDIDTLHNSMFS